ncbi:hypothetical protein BD289DRAFT_442914 [Coniella lustricola]|uniref:Uncharacterized protein n=1 Tax=Coniella lustricola TaxID=2025994 RepID=A0A2T2ZXL5_9PEZI|nr:hypothetical protein BD289DRAFT_442914 [Coniella lustricola]
MDYVPASPPGWSPASPRFSHQHRQPFPSSNTNRSRPLTPTATMLDAQRTPLSAPSHSFPMSPATPMTPGYEHSQRQLSTPPNNNNNNNNKDLRRKGPSDGAEYKGPWTEDECVDLKAIVLRVKASMEANPPSQRGGHSSQLPWSEMALDFSRAHPDKPRSAKQCREKWNEHLKWGPESRKKITPKEALFINKWVRLHGRHWAELGRLMNRPENSIKNHWYQECKKQRTREEAGREAAAAAVAAAARPSAALTPSLHHAHGYSTPRQLSQHACSPTMLIVHHQEDMHMRRLSNASAGYPPSLASDHGTDAASPRPSPIASLPQGQLRLPSLPRDSCQLPFSELTSQDWNMGSRSRSTSSQGYVYQPETRNYEVGPQLAPLPFIASSRSQELHSRPPLNRLPNLLEPQLSQPAFVDGRASNLPSIRQVLQDQFRSTIF